MNCSVAKVSVKRVCYSLKSHGKTLLEVSGGGENEEETSMRKVEKGVREQSVNSREIVRRKGVDVSGRDLVERSAQLAGICDVTDTHHTLCMLLGWQRISSRFHESFFLREKSRKGVRKEECENSKEIVKRKGVDVFWGDLVERSA